MAIFNYAAREMTAKIVYYGPGLSGKTTSIQFIHSKLSPKSKGKLVSLATETDRTLFFDFFPVEFGQVGGFRIKFNFYTVPGQVFYNTTRKLVLKGADGVVFVADSQPGMMEQNVESLENLKENLKAHGIDPDTVPFAIQYNKRDLPGALSAEEMRRKLNPTGVPDLETSATTGLGIMETMKVICKLVLEDVQGKQKRAAPRSPPPRPEAAEAAREAGPAAPEPPPVAAPPPRSAPRPERAAAVEEAPGLQRTVVLPVHGPGAQSVNLALPLELRLEAGVEAVQVAVQVRVTYLTKGEGA
ncbi:MAG: GTP-binding protein, partial [Deferrisomatales bacterium]